MNELKAGSSALHSQMTWQPRDEGVIEISPLVAAISWFRPRWLSPAWRLWNCRSTLSRKVGGSLRGQASWLAPAFLSALAMAPSKRLQSCPPRKLSGVCVASTFPPQTSWLPWASARLSKSCWLVTKSCLTLLTPHQAPLSMGFPRQEYWSGLRFSAAGSLPDPGFEPMSPALAGGFFTTELPGKPPPRAGRATCAPSSEARLSRLRWPWGWWLVVRVKPPSKKEFDLRRSFCFAQWFQRPLIRFSSISWQASLRCLGCLPRDLPFVLGFSGKWMTQCSRPFP